MFISVDIEGCTGIASFSQCGRPNSALFDWPYARKMLHHDVNAAIRGARAAGAAYILLKDGHGGCKNLLIDMLEPGVELISGANAGLDGMMEGLDGTFDAAMLIGYHALSGALHGMMDHALVGGLHRFWINGVEAGEIAASAAVAGAHGVPLVCVTSDKVGCAEAASTILGVSVYPTKRGFGRFAGEMQDRGETGPGIEEAARLGVVNRASIQPYRVSEPVTLRFAFRTTNEAEAALELPDAALVDGYSAEFTRPDFITAHRDAYTLFALSIEGRKSGD